MPGAKYNSICNPKMYRALRRQGHSKESAARISNAQSCKEFGLTLEGTPVDWGAVVVAITEKHPGHGNQKVHGKRGRAGQAGQAEYQRARGEGASAGDARAAGRAATASERGRERDERRAARTERLNTQAQRARAAANSGQVTEAQRQRLNDKADRLEARARGERVGPRQKKPAEPPKPEPQPEPPAKEFRTAVQADKHHKENTGIGPKDLTKDEESYLRGYQGFDYELINNSLRGNDKSDPDINKAVKNLDNVMKRSVLNDDVVTHRGMVAPPGSKAAALLDSLKPGSTFSDKGFTSTTVDPKGVDRFLGNLGPQPKGTRKVKMKVRVPKGSRGVYMNRAIPPSNKYGDYTKEYELLMARGGSFRVVTRTDKGDTTTIEVEYVPGP